MLGLLRQDDTDAVSQVRRAPFPQLDRIWPHQSNEPTLVFQHRDLRDLGRTAIDPLEVFGDHLFSAAQYQDLFFPTGDEQETITINEAQIAGPEPSVRSDRRPIGLGIVKVAFGNRVSTQLDLADSLIVRV